MSEHFIEYRTSHGLLDEELLDARRRPAPGKVTLTARLRGREQLRARPGEVRDGVEHGAEEPGRATDAAVGTAPPGGDEFGGLFERGGDEPQAAAHEPQSLPEATRARMEKSFGVGLGDVRVHPESERAGGSKHALTEGRDVHFAPGRYQPGTPDGDWLIGHELAHVMQQSGGTTRAQAFDGASAGRGALEAEADGAADAVLAGQRARVELRTTPGRAQAFDESEEHVPEGHGGAAPTPDLDPLHNEEGEAAHEDEELDVDAELAAIAAEGVDEVDAGGHADGIGAAGGGAEPVADQAPEIAGGEPEDALQSLVGVRPDHVAGALGEVGAAVDGEVAEERAELAQNPPEMRSDGHQVDEAAEAGGKPAETGPTGAEEAKASPTSTESEQLADDPAPAPGQDAPAPALAADTGPAASATPSGAPVSTQAPEAAAPQGAEGQAPKGVSPAELQGLASIVASAPADASSINTDAGPPPRVQLSGDTDPGKAEGKRAKLDQHIAANEQREQSESAKPMGEDDIRVAQPPEVMSAEVGAEAGAARAALPALRVDTGQRGEAIGIIARQEKGDEIDAAVTKAKADMAAEKERHEAEEAERRAQSKEEVARLKRDAEQEQDKARHDAQAEVDAARDEWRGEIDQRSTEARKKADKELQDGMHKVKTEQRKADADAAREIADGEAKAEAEKAKADKTVKDKQREADEKKQGGGGVMGWVKSKVKSFFEGIKKAISAAIDAARKAVRVAIEAATKLATAIIEKARQVIVAAIQAVGQALIAISDTLLAAFPELRDKFRQRIEGLVDGATQAVNAIADRLKAGVKAALDALGKALDAALGLLEKGLHAIVDGVAAVVDAALSAAEALAQAFGAFLVLAKDIASDPGAWLAALGASVMDGIRNHLWTAFKVAVSAWFSSKVIELLGIGGLVVQHLQEGGIDLGKIGNMAWEAAQTAIPAALIAILIEKLVSMIVPAAGAVMVILEGLQAAWGTLSRIVAAFGAFIAFLKAIKGGKAGPQFAQMLAMAAVVVLDFVSNWLIKKLRKALAKLGRKLKQLAKKLQSKRKNKNKRKDDDDEKKKKDDDDDDDDKDARNRKIIDKAKRELPPKIERLTSKGVKESVLRRQLGRWRRQYQLKSLNLQESGKSYRIVAKVNPQVDVGHGVEIDEIELLRFLDEVAEEVLNSTHAQQDAQKVTRSNQADYTRDGNAIEAYRIEKGVGSAGLANATMRMNPLAKSEGQAAVRQLHYETGGDQDVVVRQSKLFHSGREHQLISGATQNDDGTYSVYKPERYRALGQRLQEAGISGRNLAQAMVTFAKDGHLPDGFAQKGFSATDMAALRTLLYSQEPIRNPRALLHSRMAMEQLLDDKTSPAEVFGNMDGEGLHPMVPVGAQRGTRKLNENHVQTGQDIPALGTEKNNDERQARAQVDREVASLKRWIKGLDLKFSDAASAKSKKEQLKEQIRAELLKSFKKFRYL